MFDLIEEEVSNKRDVKRVSPSQLEVHCIYESRHRHVYQKYQRGVVWPGKVIRLLH